MHRPHIQGLRGVAVLLVLLYHTGLGPDSGFIGVDVFFVISGFLITGLLLREHEQTGRISLLSFWARRARRLLPAGSLVLVATCALTWALLPASQWRTVGLDAVAAAGYVLNWRLAGQAVDYLHQGMAPGPLQHFWSLSVEEQFYLFWPLLLLVLLKLRSRAAVIVTGIAVVLLGSLALALTSTGSQSYFTTQHRVWELAAGALCAAVPPGQPRSGRASAGLGWIGLGLLCLTLVLVTPDTKWPGPQTILVIVASMLLVSFGASAFILARRPLTWVGDISYPLYLWHWPLVVLASRDAPLSTRDGLAIVPISIALAFLTSYLLENPLRRLRIVSTARVSIALGLSLMLVSGAAGIALTQAPSLGAPVNPVGAGRPVEVQKSASTLAPSPANALQDLPDLYARDCQTGLTEATVHPCEYDYRAARKGPSVVAVGDSRMAQWLPALQEVARERHWHLTSMTKASCPFTDARRAVTAQQADSCLAWNQSVLRRLLDSPPALVVTSDLDLYVTARDGTPLHGKANQNEMIRGAASRLTQLRRAHISVITLQETPTVQNNPADCVSLHLGHLATCSTPRDRATRNAGVLQAASKLSKVPSLDLTDHICTARQCPAVTGDVLIYRDAYHLTATYAQTLAPFIESGLQQLLTPKLVSELSLSR
ncbi:acyltransferase family protein [Kineosporia mesophila]|uniref:acyltransferase family protein n=1 Tax=Kineosporia mesophila TaxID=566012 RepID=UPI0022AEC52C|nr:acyltransferase family protein [Kineosporia mesophila]